MIVWMLYDDTCIILSMRFFERKNKGKILCLFF